MSKKIVVRMSSLTHGANCLASIPLEREVLEKHEIPKQIESGPSRLGTAFHKWMEMRAHEPNLSDLVIKDVARENRVERSDLEFLARVAGTDPQLGDPDWVVTEQTVEQPLNGAVLRGSLDIAKYWSSHAFLEVTDYKSGRLVLEEEPDAFLHEQLIGYASVYAMALRAGGLEVKRVRGVLHKVLEFADEPDSFEWEGDQIDEAWEKTCELAQRIVDQGELAPVDRSYSVGAWCRFHHCRRECKAFGAEMQTALASVDGTLEITSENAARVFELRQLLKKTHDGIYLELKNTVEVLGPLKSEDGKKQLEFREYEQRPQLNPTHVNDAVLSAWPPRKLEAVDGESPEELAERELQSFLGDVMQSINERPKVPLKRFGLYKA